MNIIFRMAGQDVELTFVRQAAGDKPPYQRLPGDAMRGFAELFTREDSIEAQCLRKASHD